MDYAPMRHDQSTAQKLPRTGKHLGYFLPALFGRVESIRNEQWSPPLAIHQESRHLWTKERVAQLPGQGIKNMLHSGLPSARPGVGRDRIDDIANRASIP